MRTATLPTFRVSLANVRSGVIHCLLLISALMAVGLSSRATAVGSPQQEFNSCAGAELIPTFGEWPGVDGTVRAAVYFDDGSGRGPQLHIAGDFQTAGGWIAPHLARWDGERWWPVGDPASGPDGPVHALLVHDDGSGPALHVGGDFPTLPGLASPRLARWDGTAWSGVGGGASGIVRALCTFDDGLGDGPALYAGGSFTSVGGIGANRIAKWNGRAWSPLLTGLNQACRALVVFDDGLGDGPRLHVGGAFTTAGGVAAIRMARWNGIGWSALGGGIDGFGGAVNALAVAPLGPGGAERLYVGGSFTTAGGGAASNVASWDGLSWSALDSGVEGLVYALHRFDPGLGEEPILFVGGALSAAGGVPIGDLATWDGGAWSVVPGSLSSQEIRTFASCDGEGGDDRCLYAGGDLFHIDLYTVGDIARWDGRQWHPMGTGLTDSVQAAVMFDHGTGEGPQLHIGGSFRWGSGETLNRVARWNGAAWVPLGEGFNGPVRALHVHDDGRGGGPTLYAGGAFNVSGATSTNFIARWDGAAWVPLGSGTSGVVHVMATHDDGLGAGPALYVGGRFVEAGGGVVNNIAKWDGSAWSALGTGVLKASNPPDVHALARFDDGLGGKSSLFVAGNFWTADGLTVNSIGRWDGVEWSAVGSGLSTNAIARAALIFDDGGGPALYLGGNMNSLPGMPATRVVRWDGVAWKPVGFGISLTSIGGIVYTLAEHDAGLGDGPSLYAGRDFLFASGLPAKRLIRWSGVEWEAIDPGFDATVLAALSVDVGAEDRRLVLGGEFRTSAAGDSYIASMRPCLPQPPLFGDLDGDGVVNGADLSMLLDAWGRCAEGPTCLEDLDGDGVVDGRDLGLLLAAWER
jgi:hypothetical protein